jgi:hypothetical protein
MNGNEAPSSEKFWELFSSSPYFEGMDILSMPVCLSVMDVQASETVFKRLGMNVTALEPVSADHLTSP